jgi:hypothetical protein
LLRHENSLSYDRLLLPNTEDEKTMIRQASLVIQNLFTILLSTLASPQLGAQMLHAQMLQWRAVDTMQNAFGLASTQVKPLSYDNYLNALVVIHRGATSYVPSSGSLVYNRTFPNNGGTAQWRRVLPDLNAGTSATCRYPSIAISNPANSADTSQALVVWAAPNLLNGGGFGGISFGVDPFGAGTPYAVATLDDTSYGSSTTLWTRTGSMWVYWVTQSRNGIMLWRTNDYITIDRRVPPQWRSDSANVTFICGKERNGISYFGVFSVFPGDSADAANVGFSCSSDNGATWSSWIRPSPGNWTRIPAIQNSIYKTWADFTQNVTDNTVGHSFDMLVDANGYVHFFGAVADTSEFQERQAIVEIFQTPTGWDAKIIKTNLNTKTRLDYGGVYQTGRNIQASISPDGSYMYVIWLDAGTTLPTDTLPDIWLAGRSITSARWSTPINLTETPNQAELLVHAAPVLKWISSASPTMFISRGYQSGVSTYPPSSSERTVFYVSSFFTFIDDVDSRPDFPVEFSLSQNYPNPFNPTTRIEYAIPKTSHVSLKVFDLLGRQVATLVDELQGSGFKSVEFDANGLASGVYLYRIQADGFTQTKKLILLR